MKKGKMVLPIDFKFKDGPSEEEEPGDIINRSKQASLGLSITVHNHLEGIAFACTLQCLQEMLGGLPLSPFSAEARPINAWCYFAGELGPCECGATLYAIIHAVFGP